MFSKDIHALAIRMYQQIQSYRKLAQLTGISRSTLQRWLTTTSSVVRLPRPNKASDVLESVRNLLQINQYYTQDELKSKLCGMLGVNISRRTISRCIRRIGFTRKRSRTIVEKEGLDEERRTFRWQLGVIPPDDVISIDESAFYFDMKPITGYSKKGTRLKTAVHSKRPQRWTLLMAVSNSRVVDYELFHSSCDAKIFANFVSKLDVAGKRYLMMDNASIHTSECVRMALRSQNLLPLFLPSYSPQFQPIECVFSMVKFQYRKLPCLIDDDSFPDEGCGIEGDVFMRVMYAINCIEAKALHNTFWHCWQA